MMNAAEYVIFLKQSLDLSEQGWKAWREDLESWQRQRSEQFNDPSFQYRYSLESSMQSRAMPKKLGDWLSDTFNQTIVQPLKDALPSSVRSKVANVPLVVLPIRALNGHALKAPNGEPVIVINQGLLNCAQFYKEIQPSAATLGKRFGIEASMAYMERAYKFLIDRFLHPDIPFPEELIKMPESMVAFCLAWAVGMETFVVAHEFAHIYANHLDQANAKMLSVRPGGTTSAEFYQFSQQREYEADLLAWQWYQEVWRSIPAVGWLNELPGRITPLSFFTMLDLVEKNVRLPDAYSTHPPALARLTNLIMSFAKSADEEAVEAAVEELGIARSNPVFDKLES